MALTKLGVMFGHLEGNAGNFARDPSGYLSIQAGIFQKHGLDVSWDHIQGTEERYRKLTDGTAQISLVVGRASLQHFLTSKTTRIIGCTMNSCPYYLITEPSIGALAELKGKIVACRDAPSRNTSLRTTLEKLGRLRVGENVELQLSKGDQNAYELLEGGKVQAALLPRPFGFWAEEKGFKRVADWPDIVDDPLPITIETTAKILRDREQDLKTFLEAHREGIRFFKSHRDGALELLRTKFGHSPSFAAKTFDNYVCCMDERLTVDFAQVEKLLAQVAPDTPGGARQVSSEWIMPGVLRD